MKPITVKCVVEGRVQGVFYRASTVERATSLGLNGWVRNCENGNVELVAAGQEAGIQQLIAWLWQGPPRAEVVAVSVEEWVEPVEPGFTVVR